MTCRSSSQKIQRPQELFIARITALHGDIRHDSLAIDLLAGWCEPFGNGELDARTIGELKHLLNCTLPKCLLPHNGRTLGILQSSGHDFRCARRPLIHQNHEREICMDARITIGHFHDFGLAGLDLCHRRPPGEEVPKYRFGSTKEATGIIPQIENYSFGIAGLNLGKEAWEILISELTKLEQLHDRNTSLIRDIDFGDFDGVAHDIGVKFHSIASDAELCNRSLGTPDLLHGFGKIHTRKTFSIHRQNLITRLETGFFCGRTRERSQNCQNAIDILYLRADSRHFPLDLGLELSSNNRPHECRVRIIETLDQCLSCFVRGIVRVDILLIEEMLTEDLPDSLQEIIFGKFLYLRGYDTHSDLLLWFLPFFSSQNRLIGHASEEKSRISGRKDPLHPENILKEWLKPLALDGKIHSDTECAPFRNITEHHPLFLRFEIQ